MDPRNFIRGYFSLSRLLMVGLVFSAILFGYSITQKESTSQSKINITNQAAQVSSSAWRDFWCDVRSLIWLDCVDGVAPVSPSEYAVVTERANDNQTSDNQPISPPENQSTTTVIQNITNETTVRPIERETVREVVIRDGQVDTSRFITRQEYDNQVDAIMRSIENSGGGGGEQTPLRHLMMLPR